jgi:hypothetical protein
MDPHGIEEDVDEIDILTEEIILSDARDLHPEVVSAINNIWEDNISKPRDDTIRSRKLCSLGRHIAELKIIVDNLNNQKITVKDDRDPSRNERNIVHRIRQSHRGDRSHAQRAKRRREA